MSVIEQFTAEVAPHWAMTVVFARDVWAAGDTTVESFLLPSGRRRPRVLVVLDEGLDRAQPRLAGRIEAWLQARADRLDHAAPLRRLPGGEGCKRDFPRFAALLEDFLHARLSRHDYVLILGGGAVLDAAGLAAALAHRGLRVIRFPSTALAQGDSGVGVKTAINFAGVKNGIGAFAPPHAVINDAALLDTLPREEWTGGLAEAFKVALIRDAAFHAWLVAQAPRLGAGDRDALDEAIRRSARLHLDHIRTSGDPFEMGRARPLDFGHWSAHKLESMTEFTVGHGAAVGVGIALDTLYAHRMGWLGEAEARATLQALQTAGIAIWHEALARRTAGGGLEILAGLEEFREHLGGDLCVTFPCGVGARQEVGEVRADVVETSVQTLRAWAAAGVRA